MVGVTTPWLFGSQSLTLLRVILGRLDLMLKEENNLLAGERR